MIMARVPSKIQLIGVPRLVKQILSSYNVGFKQSLDIGYIAYISLVISIILAHIVCVAYSIVFIFMFLKIRMFTTKERRAIAFVRIS